MELETYEMDIARAKASLDVDDTEFVLLPLQESREVVYGIEEKFVEEHGWLWWWEHLKKTDFAAYHAENRGFECLTEVIPCPEELVWFIVEPFGENRDFSVYKARAKHIQSVIGECMSFEYYVVAHDLGWLMSENHHGVFLFVGEPITTRLREMTARRPGEWRVAYGDGEVG